MAPKTPTRPMTLANMRGNGVRWLIATCLDCRHSADVDADALAGEVYVPEAGRRMVCSKCEGRRIETRPAWHRAKRPGMGE